MLKGTVLFDTMPPAVVVYQIGKRAGIVGSDAITFVIAKTRFYHTFIYLATQGAFTDVVNQTADQYRKSTHLFLCTVKRLPDFYTVHLV